MIFRKVSCNMTINLIFLRVCQTVSRRKDLSIPPCFIRGVSITYAGYWQFKVSCYLFWLASPSKKVTIASAHLNWYFFIPDSKL